MKRKWLVLLAALSFGAMCLGQNANSSAAAREDLSSATETHEPPMLGIHWSRGFNPSARVHALKGNNPDMTYHGGVMPSTVSEAIFWGPSWANSSFTGDKIAGLDSCTADSTAPIMLRLLMSTPARMGRLGPL